MPENKKGIDWRRLFDRESELHFAVCFIGHLVSNAQQPYGNASMRYLFIDVKLPHST